MNTVLNARTSQQQCPTDRSFNLSIRFNSPTENLKYTTRTLIHTPMFQEALQKPWDFRASLLKINTPMCLSIYIYLQQLKKRSPLQVLLAKYHQSDFLVQVQNMMYSSVKQYTFCFTKRSLILSKLKPIIFPEPTKHTQTRTTLLIYKNEYAQMGTFK